MSYLLVMLNQKNHIKQEASRGQDLIKNQKNEPILSRERHIKIMKNILEILSGLEFEGNLDIAAFEYRAALNLCMEINQKFDIEKILDIIFRDFCIGK